MRGRPSRLFCLMRLLLTAVPLAGRATQDAPPTAADLPLAWPPTEARVQGLTIQQPSDLTAGAVVDDGALRVHHSGLVQLTATAGTVEQVGAFPVVLTDDAAVRELLEDAVVARLVTGLSPTVGARVPAALAASAGAPNAGAAPMLRTSGARVAAPLCDADDPADRAVLAVLELYVRQLALAPTFATES